MENTNERNVKVLVADPSALGLFGLAIITLVASSQKLGLTSGVSLVLPWAIFLGASAQLVACINDFKHNMYLELQHLEHTHSSGMQWDSLG